MARRQLKLGLRLYGVGGPGQHGLWKDPRVPNDASIDIDWYIATAKAAEEALFDVLFIVDSQFIDAGYPPHYLNRLEPLTLLSAVATHTRHIGLVGTLSTTYNSPFNVARRFASLDHISRGRAGWNVVTSFDTGTSRNYGLAEHLDYATRYGRAHEHVEVVRGLWDSYEDDAFPADVARNLFVDPAKLHALDHHGEHFDVAGPLNISRSRQGQPVIFQAGVSEEGRTLAAHVAEGIYAPPGTLAETKDYYADVKSRTAALGRDPDHLLIFLGAAPVVAATDAEAHRVAREIYETDNDFSRKLAAFGRAFGAHDFSGHDLDAPFPDLSAQAERGGRTRGAAIVARATAEGLTLRQTVEAFTAFTPSPFTGDPRTVAATIERWFEERSFDGLNLGFRTAEDLARFAADVLPILRGRGLVRSGYDAETLRGNLGIPVPANRHTVARAAAQAEPAAPPARAATPQPAAV